MKNILSTTSTAFNTCAFWWCGVELKALHFAHFLERDTAIISNANIYAYVSLFSRPRGKGIKTYIKLYSVGKEEILIFPRFVLVWP